MKFPISLLVALAAVTLPAASQTNPAPKPSAVGSDTAINRIVVGFTYDQWWYSCHAGVIFYLMDFIKQ